jgi:hypothetical protein
MMDKQMMGSARENIRPFRQALPIRKLSALAVGRTVRREPYSIQSKL